MLKYGILSIKIINNRKKIINTFNIKKLDYDKKQKAIIFLKIIIDIKNADILDYKKDKTINNNFKITFECSPDI